MVPFPGTERWLHQLGVSSGLAFNANTASTPWWTLSVPLTVNAQLLSPTLDLDSKPLTLYSHSFNVANAPGGFGSGGGVSLPL